MIIYKHNCPFDNTTIYLISKEDVVYWGNKDFQGTLQLIENNIVLGKLVPTLQKEYIRESEIVIEFNSIKELKSLKPELFI